MSDIIIPGTIRGKEYPAWAVKAVDGILQKAKKQGVWPTVDFIVKRWMEKNPEKAMEFRSAVKTVTRTRARNTGASKSMDTRWLAEVPPEIMGTFDILLRPEIEKDKKKFWYTFAKKYPLFRVAEKI